MPEDFSFQNREEIEKPSVPTLDQFLTLIKTKNLARMERFFVTFPSIVGSNGREMTLLCEEAALPGKTISPRTFRINGLNEYRAETVDFMGDSITLQFLIDTDWIARHAMEEWMNQCVSPPGGKYNVSSKTTTSGREVSFYTDYAKDIVLHALVPAGIPGEKLANWSPTQADFDLKKQLPKSWTEGKPGLLLNKALNFGKTKIDRAATKAKTQLFGAIAPLANPLIEAFRDTETIAFSIKLVECWPKSINIMPLSWNNPGVHRMNVTFTYKYWVSSPPYDFNENFEDEIMGKANEAISKQLKKVSDKIPGAAKKLSSLGNDLKAKAISKFGKRFGG
jgi:hypothetical protein